jgi:hypothetical protein
MEATIIRLGSCVWLRRGRAPVIIGDSHPRRDQTSPAEAHPKNWKRASKIRGSPEKTRISSLKTANALQKSQRIPKNHKYASQKLETGFKNPRRSRKNKDIVVQNRKCPTKIPKDSKKSQICIPKTGNGLHKSEAVPKK